MKLCQRCGQPLDVAVVGRKARLHRSCRDERQRDAIARWHKAKRETDPGYCERHRRKRELAGEQRGAYHPHRLDLLAAACIGQAWKDYHGVTIDGEKIPPEMRDEAGAWLREVARDWLDTLGVQIQLPIGGD